MSRTMVREETRLLSAFRIQDGAAYVIRSLYGYAHSVQVHCAECGFIGLWLCRKHLLAFQFHSEDSIHCGLTDDYNPLVLCHRHSELPCLVPTGRDDAHDCS